MVKQIQFCALLVVFTACGERNSGNKEALRFDTGYVDSNRVYINQTFDLQFKIPVNYYFLENLQIGLGRPAYSIKSCTERNVRRTLGLHKIASMDERFVSYKNLNSLINTTYILCLYYSSDTTIEYLDISKNDRQVSLFIQKHYSEEEKQAGFSRELRTIENLDYRFYPKELDLSKYEHQTQYFLGYRFNCIETHEDGLLNRSMILGETNYNGYTLFIRLIYKTENDLNALKTILADFHL
jgi:hypothetical protein